MRSTSTIDVYFANSADSPRTLRLDVFTTDLPALGGGHREGAKNAEVFRNLIVPANKVKLNKRLK